MFGIIFVYATLEIIETTTQKYNTTIMKKLSLIFTMLIALLIISAKGYAIDEPKADIQTNGPQVNSPENINDEGDPETVYWYFIRIRIDSKKKDIEILGPGTKISMGSKNEFIKAVWKGISQRQVAIGPFASKEQADNSKVFYKKSKDKITEMPTNTGDTYYWFQVSFRELKRIGSYEFTHSPAAVSSGSYNEFIDALFEGVTFQRLSVGPFATINDETRGIYVDGNVWAEKAKTIYRANE
ncbi:MAG: hypothetical protein MJ211_03345 [Bacteroidales bacterium]|nr:hypothetical protein [Bacteroidales bacterium]